jgi:alpha-glucosidase
MMLALPGSAYLYQGEELGLHEVGDLPEDVLQDPVFLRSGGEFKGRDGCRVPLPWISDGPSLGFGSGRPHLPQPGWFAGCSVEAEESDPESTLSLYRRALHLRRELREAGEGLAWIEPDGSNVLHFRRPGGWHSLTNFGPQPVAVPQGEVVLSSAPLVDGLLPSDTTAWVIGAASA